MSRVTHYRSTPTGYTACSKDSPRLIVTNVETKVTCSNCKKALGPLPKTIGRSRGRALLSVTCKGGPWAGQSAVFPRQESGPMSLLIRVGAFVGRYNLNNGVWEDDK